MQRRLSLPMVKAGRRASDAYWSFEVAPGSYELTASADGYESNTRTVVVAAGDSIWASIGLMPVAAESDSELEEEVSETDSADPTRHRTETPMMQLSKREPMIHLILHRVTRRIPVTKPYLGMKSLRMPTYRQTQSRRLRDEGCSQTGSQNLLMALLGVLWMLRRSSKQDYRLS